MENVYIISAARTAVGKYLGSLKTVPSELLAKEVIKAAIERAGLEKKDIELTVLGQVNVNAEARNVARVAELLAGLPEEIPAYTVDLQCGSGLQAVRCAIAEIQNGAADIILAGGTENMSRAIYYLPPSVRYEGFKAGAKFVYDEFERGSQRVQPPALYPDLNMGLTAENVADKYGITREEMDAFAYDSQMKAIAAIDAGKFREEIIPYKVEEKKNTFIFDTDEFPRRDINIEKLAALKPAFRKDGTGRVTAGNASGMNDGASAVVVMSERKMNELGKTPMAKIISHKVVGVDPKIMGIGPVNAIKGVLADANLTLEDIDLIELNEAFAAQSLGVLKELGLEPGTEGYKKVNVNGGAVALGHALGNSGTRILTTLMYELKRRNGKYGIASLCIGGGQGIAMLIENLCDN